MQDRIFNMLLNEDEITWKTIIYDLIKTNQMEPWDIDLSLLAERFLERVRALKEMDFRISGKIIFAAAILLKIKADRLLNEDLTDFDRLLNATDQTEEQFYDELEQELVAQGRIPASGEEFSLIPRTPQERKRKISVNDLVDALGKALEVEQRRLKRFVPDAPAVEKPEKQTDISVVIKNVYSRIAAYISQRHAQRMTFSELVPSGKKDDKITTFIPLLHLTNQRKVDLEQEQHFGEIDIVLRR